MAISRSLMNRQLQANGGIMQVAPREKFGLGSSLKKFVRKIIPNEVADIAVKAAPFVAPFNPALAGAMAGIGSFDQTGSIGDSLKSGALTYGGGQAARYIGGAGFQGNPFASGGAFTPSGFTQGFSSPLGSETGLGKFFSNRGTEGVQGVQVGDEFPVDDLGSDRFSDKLISKTDVDLGSDTFSDNMVFKNTPEKLKEKVTEQVVASTGSPNQMSITESIKQIVSPNSTMGDRGNAALDLLKRTGKAAFTKEGKNGPVPDKAAILGALAFTASYAEARALAAETGVDPDLTEEEYDELKKADKQEEYAGYLTNFCAGRKDGGRIGFSQGADLEQKLKDLADYYMERGLSESDAYETAAKELYKADGGRIGFKFGSEPEDAEVGIMTIDVEAGDDEEEENDLMAGITFSKAERAYLYRRLGGSSTSNKNKSMPNLYYILNDPGSYPADAKMLKEIAIMGMKKDGGRIGYKDGTSDIFSVNEAVAENMQIGKLPYETTSMILELNRNGKSVEEISQMTGIDIADVGEMLKIVNMKSPINLGGDFDALNKMLAENVEIRERPSNLSYKAQGGRIGFAGGSGASDRVAQLMLERSYLLSKDPDEDVTYIDIELERDFGIKMKAEGGIMEAKIPTGQIRKNNAGVTERDYRDEGGFVPVGIKERADDVPAMLSKNEFVMTADAVRGIGNGSVEEGSKKLYNTMKQAEQIGKA